MARYFRSGRCLSSVLPARSVRGHDPVPGRISWTGTLTEGHTLTFVMTRTVAQARITNTAYVSGRLPKASDTATYYAGRTKLFVPLVIQGAIP